MSLRLTIVRTAPPEEAGSMAGYAQMVEEALQDSPYSVQLLNFFDPRPGHSMWTHHGWRMRNRSLLHAPAKEGLLHLLDGSMMAMMPRQLLSRVLVTVHDWIPWRQMKGMLPGNVSLPGRLLLHVGARKLKHVRGCCAVSSQTQADIQRWARADPGPVIPLPVRSFPAQAHGPVPRPYILHVGNSAAYKNRRQVINTFARLLDQEDLSLVIVGAPTPDDQAQVVQFKDRVHWMHNVTDEELAALYANAECLLFPSLFEGFGMPVVEAMSLGCPVVCSDAGSLPEVAGDATLLASPDDTNQFVRLCRELITNKQVSARLIERGHQQATTFTKDRFRHELLSWYAMHWEGS